MEFATTSKASHNLFPRDQRFNTKRLGCNVTDFSDASLLNPQSLSRIIGRDGENMATVATKKRQHSDEANPPKRRLKMRIEVDSTTKVKSITPLKASLDKSVSNSKQETKTKVTKPVDARSITTKPEKSITVYETETKKPDLRNLIAKAQQKIKEKRKIDHRQVYITNQRIAARLALHQVVAIDAFDDHLKYHRELEQLGYTFIQDEIDCLNKFKLLSRSDYYYKSKKKFQWCEEDSTRKKHHRSRSHRSMKHSLEDPQITDNGESAESYNQRETSVGSSTSVRIQSNDS